MAKKYRVIHGIKRKLDFNTRNAAIYLDFRFRHKPDAPEPKFLSAAKLNERSIKLHHNATRTDSGGHIQASLARLNIRQIFLAEKQQLKAIRERVEGLLSKEAEEMDIFAPHNDLTTFTVMFRTPEAWNAVKLIQAYDEIAYMVYFATAFDLWIYPTHSLSADEMPVSAIPANRAMALAKDASKCIRRYLSESRETITGVYRDIDRHVTLKNITALPGEHISAEPPEAEQDQGKTVIEEGEEIDQDEQKVAETETENKEEATTKTETETLDEADNLPPAA